MTKFSKKWATITASLVLGATALGVGVVTWGMEEKTASAAVSTTGTAPENVVKLETLIDDVSTDFIINHQYLGMIQNSSTTIADSKKIVWNEGEQRYNDTYQYTFSTEAGTKGNVYGGNVAYSMSKGPVGFHFKNENESVVSFNTRWDSTTRYTLHVRSPKPTNMNSMTVDSGYASYGYSIWIRPDVTNAVGYVHSTSTVLAGAVNLGAPTIKAADIATGTLVTVTYGVWTDDNGTASDATDDKDILYLKLESVDEATNVKTKVKEWWWTNEIATNAPLYYSETVDGETVYDTSYSSIVFGQWNVADPGAITIEGISEPLTALGTTVAEEYWMGEDIASVAAPEGYTITSTGTLVEGKNVLNATYNGTYYGQPYQTDNATVIVNTVNKDITLDGTYPYGTALSSITLPEGYAWNTTASKLTKIGTQELAAIYTEGNRTLDVTVSVNVTRNVTNIEDLVDDYSDIAVKSRDYNWLSEDQWNAETENTYDLTTKAKDGVTDYNGNLVSISGDALGYWFLNTDDNSTMSFITRWSSVATTDTARITLRMRSSRLSVLEGGLIADAADAGDGYYVEFRTGTNFKNTIVRYRTAEKTVAKVADLWHNGTGDTFLAGLKEDDLIKYTFGVTTYDNCTPDEASDDVDILYFAINVLDETTGEVTKSKEYTYEVPSSAVYYASEERYSAVVFGRPNTTMTEYVAIEGVERPIFANGYDTTAEEGTYKEGDLLSTVSLPDGYTWKNGNEVLDGDKDTYEATYALTYYGKSVTLPVSVKVDVTAIRNTVIFKRADGTEISRAEYKADETVALPTASLSAGKTVVVGWLNSEEKLYPVGYEYSVGDLTESVETVYTLVEIDFSMADGAGVRLVKNDGYGGLRYIVQSSDIEEWIGYATGIYGVLVPYEEAYYNGGFTAEALANAKQLGNSYVDETDYAGYTLYSFAMTDILYSNYTRQFVGGAYITVNFETGEGKVFTPFTESKNVRSIYDVALKAYAAHLAKINEQTAAGNTPVGLYGTNGVAMLKDYIFDVVDITVDMTTGTVTLSDGVNGLLEALPYTVASTTATLKGGSASVYEFTLTVSNMPEVADVTKIPVLVRVFNGTEYVGTARAVTPVGVDNGDGTITITFEQDASAINYLVEME